MAPAHVVLQEPCLEPAARARAAPRDTRRSAGRPTSPGGARGVREGTPPARSAGARHPGARLGERPRCRRAAARPADRERLDRPQRLKVTPPDARGLGDRHRPQVVGIQRLFRPAVRAAAIPSLHAVGNVGVRPDARREPPAAPAAEGGEQNLGALHETLLMKKDALRQMQTGGQLLERFARAPSVGRFLAHRNDGWRHELESEAFSPRRQLPVVRPRASGGNRVERRPAEGHRMPGDLREVLAVLRPSRARPATSADREARLSRRLALALSLQRRRSLRGGRPAARAGGAIAPSRCPRL